MQTNCNGVVVFQQGYNSDLQVKKWQYKKEGSDWDIGENEEKKVKVQFKREHLIIFPGPD